MEGILPFGIELDRGVIGIIALAVALPTVWAKHRLDDEADDLGIRTLLVLVGIAVAAAVASAGFAILVTYVAVSLL